MEQEKKPYPHTDSKFVYKIIEENKQFQVIRANLLKNISYKKDIPDNTNIKMICSADLNKKLFPGRSENSSNYFDDTIGHITYEIDSNLKGFSYNVNVEYGKV